MVSALPRLFHLPHPCGQASPQLLQQRAGLVHNRFPVGPIADVPYLQRVAVAHRMHHAAKYKGVPWGLFLGPQELAAVGATAELDALCAEAELKRRKLAKK